MIFKINVKIGRYNLKIIFITANFLKFFRKSISLKDNNTKSFNIKRIVQLLKSVNWNKNEIF